MLARRAVVPLVALLALSLFAPLAFAQAPGGAPEVAPPSDVPEGVEGTAGTTGGPQLPGSDYKADPAADAKDANKDGVPEGIDVTDGGGLLDIELSPGEQVAIAVTLVGLSIAASLLFKGGTKFVNADNVLENEARRSIFEYIQAHPGVHLRATAAALDLSTTNVLWHLRKLEEANLVSSKKFEGYKVFYPVAGGLESKRRAIAMAVLRNDNAADILQYVLSNPSAHQREIARALGVNHGTIRWHLRKLNEAGLVLQVKKEHTSQYYVSELGVQLLGEKAGDRAAPTLQEMEALSAAEAARPAAPAAPAPVVVGGSPSGGSDEMREA